VRLGLGIERVQGETALEEERGAAEEDPPSLDRSLDAPAREGAEPRGRLGPDPLDFGRRQDRRGEGMLGSALDPRGEPEEISFGKTRGGADGEDPGLPLRQRPRLVEEESVGLLEGLDRLGLRDEDPRAGSPPGPDDDRHRGREAERAGAGDDQDRDGGDDRVREGRLRPEGEPEGEGEECDRHDGGDEPGGDPVGEPLDRSPGEPDLGDGREDPREDRLRPDPRGSKEEGAGRVARPPDDRVAGALLDREGLARDGRLVDPAPPLEDDPVDGDVLSRPDMDTVADPDSGDRHVLLLSILPEAADRLRDEIEERSDRIGGPPAGLPLEDLAEEDEEGDRDRGLEMDAHAAAGVAVGDREEPGRDRRGEAVEVGRFDPRRDQGEHVGRAGEDRGVGLPVEGERAPEDDGRREGELDPLGEAVGGVSPRAHPEDEDGNAEERSELQAPEVVGGLGVLLLPPDRDRLERHPALRAGAGAVPDDLRMHRAGVEGARW
jgi:hypothetical protein